jgi:hypothetical protein
MVNAYLLPIGDTVSSAWDKVKGSKKTFWAAIGITVLIGFAIGFISGLLSNYSDIAAGIVNFIGQVVTTLLQMGLLYLGILRGRDAPINFKMMFRAFETPIILRIIGVYIIQFLIFLPVSIIFVFLPIIVYGGEIGNVLSSGLTLSNFLLIAWFVIGALVAIFITLRLMLSMGFVVDQGVNSWSAVKKSFKATRCNELRLLGILVFQIVMIILGVIPLLIGLIWTLPFVLIIYGVTYRKLLANLNA